MHMLVEQKERGQSVTKDQLGPGLNQTLIIQLWSLQTKTLLLVKTRLCLWKCVVGKPILL